MSWSYPYSSLTWTSLAIAVLTGVLGWYSWRRRREPGAKALAIACALATVWAVGSVLESAGRDPSTKIMWYGAKTALLLPIVCAVTAFILQYAGLGRFLTRRTVLLLLVLPSMVVSVLVLTNPLHGIMWTDAVADGADVRVTINVWGWVGLGYSVVLAILNLVVLFRLFVVSPRHRWPAGLMLAGHLVSRYTFIHEVLWLDYPLRLPPDAITIAVPFAIYAVALFGFHVFDPLPAARKAALEQMVEGMLVVDARGSIVDVNHIAQEILGHSVAELRGRAVGELLPLVDIEHEAPDNVGASRHEISLGDGGSGRQFMVSRFQLRDPSGRSLGQMYMLHDVTEQKDTQARLLEHEQMVATLREREHLARELHDGVGQVPGYVSLQTQAIRKRLRDGDTERADMMLTRLAEVAQQAHGDVRELILSLKAASPVRWSFESALTRYLRDVESQYGVRTSVVLGEGLALDPFEPGVGVQVLRVVQEAVSNARRHGAAQAVRVIMEPSGDRARLIVEDDGFGFDLGTLHVDSARQFGLSLMRERMADVGGNLRVDSEPGAGTRVFLEAPIRTHGQDEA